MARSTRPRSVVALLGAGAVALSTLAAVSVASPAQAAPAGHIVISEVYGGGGFAANDTFPESAFTHDFVELYNPTDQAVSLEGWAVFYGSGTRSAGNVTQRTNLTGSIPAHGYYLVQQAGNPENGEQLPTPEVQGTINMSGSSGLVILSNQQANITALPTGSIAAGTAGIIDAVGFGTANTFESQNQGTALSGTTSAHRIPVDTDTDNNNNDFMVSAPTPTNSEEPPGTVDDLVISEVYGAGGNANSVFENDFIEIHNPTATDLPVDGLSVQGRSATNTSAATPQNTIPLTGTIPAGGYYLVGADGSTTPSTPLPPPDATGSMTIAIAGWQVWLAKSTTGLDPADGDVTLSPDPLIIDFVGAATNSASYEGAAVTQAPTATQSVARPGAHADTDNNSIDFSRATPEPKNTLASVGQLTAVSPGDQMVTIDEAITPITLNASGGTPPYTWDFDQLPAGLTETSDGVIGGTPTALGDTSVTATVTDSAAPTTNSAEVTFTITVIPPLTLRTIAEIQGTGAATPFANQTVLTRGVVTARYPSGQGSMAGFVIQTGGEEGVDYETPGASDAIFVFSGNKTAPAIGETVEVKGLASERFDSTQINASGAADTITVLGTPQPPVVANDVIPGTDCVIPDCPTAAELNEMREEYEHEAFQPTGPYTVTDSYDGSPFDGGFGMQGEIGLAAERDLPLMIPTETIDQSDIAALEEMRAYNEAHKLVLDDAKSLDYTATANRGTPFPWITPTHPVRVGAPVTFPQPVILKYDFGVWRILPREEVAGGEDGQDLVAIENTRTNAPEDVLGTQGDLKIATFNMLNYFNTFGEDWAASDGTATGGPGTTYNFTNPRRCNYYTDRNGVRITNDTCEQDAKDPLTGLNVKLPGPRGAANEASFLRQEAKLVNAINTIDADVMSLEEVENSIKLYDAGITNQDPADANRDDALERLVTKLNEVAGANRWALAQSPRPQALPTVQEQDAIRSAFIYNPATVEPVGRSQVLVNSPAMRNAREPLAQAFKPVGGGRADAFIVIVNHFKSKGGPQGTAPPATGDNVDVGDGAGFYNGDRKRQAQALVAFANQVSADKNIEPVFLTGDFNSYSAEDPVQVIEAAGYTNLKPSDGSTSYNFGGLAGSLDHVFANAAAAAMVTGEDIWEINANESVYYEYSRYNYSAADLYDTSVFRSSDHNPEIIGIDVGALDPDPSFDTVQILATNDFHGRLLDDPGSGAAGAAPLAGAVKELRAQNANTVFAAAGDLIGASTFESFIQQDNPTIDALNEAGLEVSAVGNHEFDQGYDDLVGRVMPRAEWTYIGSNVVYKNAGVGHQAGDPALPEVFCQTLPNGKVVGFVGAVTEDLPTLVSQEALADVRVTDIVDSVNEHAEELKAPGGCTDPEGADLVVMLVHEGAATTSLSSVTDTSTTFGAIVADASPEIDAIVSGHTHLAYNHKVDVPAWADRTVKKRPVVSAGQYGTNLNRLQFEFEGDELVNVRQTVLQLKDYDADPATQDIVDDAVAFADVKGSEVLGDIEDEFARAGRVGDDGQIVESRGAESTLGNLIAEVQRWKTEADIGFMNPGGLRDDIEGTAATPREVTYREAANAQPFANTLVTMDLTGAQIKDVLEEQWQRDADGNVPSRPFLRLGTSEGFTATYDPSRAEGDRVTGMFLDGQPLEPTATYKVSVTSFLAGAGDNFWTLAEGDNVQDTAQTDLQALVEYLDTFAAHGSGDVLPVGYDQHQVGVKINGTGPFEAGDSVTVDLSSLVMTGVLQGAIIDEQDDQVRLMDGATQLAIGTVGDKTLVNNLYDERGTATLTFTVPAGVGDGTTYFTLEGLTTGTEVPIGIPTSDGLVDVTVSGTDQSAAYGEPVTVPVTVTPPDATGTVKLMQGATELGGTTLASGAGSITLSGGSLPVGVHHLTLAYAGDATYGAATGTVTVTVTKRDPAVAVVSVNPTTVEVNGGTSSIQVAVTTAGAPTPTGDVEARLGGPSGTVLATGTLDGTGAATLVVGPFTTLGAQDVWIGYLGDATTAAQSTVAQVTVEAGGGGPGGGGSDTVTSVGTISAVVYGTGGSVTVTVTGPGPVTGQVQLLEGSTLIGSATLTGGTQADSRVAAAAGTATITIPPKALSVGQHTLTVKYLGDATNKPSQTSLQVTVAKAASRTVLTVKPTRVVVGQSRITLVADVSATGVDPTGRVAFTANDVEIGTAPVVNGRATLRIGPSPAVATLAIGATYQGDDNVETSTATGTLRVVKAPVAINAKVKPKRVVVDRTATRVRVAVRAAGHQVVGKVRVRGNGTTRTVRLQNGKAVVNLGRWPSTGKKTVRVVYLGSAKAQRGSAKVTVTVRPKRGR